MAKKKKTSKSKAAGKKGAVKKATRKPAAAKSNWVVTMSGDRAIADVARELSKAGFSVDRTLDQIGVITGKSGEKALAKLRAIRGVADVSPEQKVDIGPPDSGETW
jgi:hypothetical protein